MIVDNLPNETFIEPSIVINFEPDQQKIKVNEINLWRYTFVAIGKYEISIRYEGNNYLLGTVNVVNYSENADFPIINAEETEVYFTAIGKSNS
jgi:hypothetical protein